VWLSIFQNKPTTNAKLDFNVKIEGDDLSGSCKYENGMFYSDTGANSDGCTVSAQHFPPIFRFETPLLTTRCNRSKSCLEPLPMSSTRLYQILYKSNLII